MRATVMVLALACFFAAPCVMAQETYCDDMEGPGWTFYHENPVYDGVWYALYTTADSHSPDRSIRTSLHGGGYAGLDSDRAVAERIFTLGGDYVVTALSVWYNSMGITGSSLLDAGCYVQIHALNAAEEVLDAQAYLVSCFDDNDIHSNWEALPGWYYQECRPDEYEAGAPDYCRLADGSIQPPVGSWYRLQVDPSTDLDLTLADWSQVEYLKVRLIAFGCFMADNNVGVYWDDFCYTRDFLVPVEESTWGSIKAMFQ